ncbi:MAG: DUF5625 family protein [Smithellaceae bacterium]|jgi:hypothetical protein
MNQNKIIMKLKRLVAVCLMLFPCMTACAAFWSTSPPTPVVKFPFDVSKRDSTVNQEFRIREYRSYYFALWFDYFGEADEYRVFALVGDGSGSRENPGIDIPIHIKIYKLDTGNLPLPLIYEKTIATKHCYAHGFDSSKKREGNYRREIIAINLKPGMYRVEVNTIEDRPEFSGTPSYLQIEGHPDVKFFPNSIK